MAEQPPLNRIHVFGYSANDRDYPIVSLVADPRVAGYKVPEDLSACPDKRYPNHVFTGAQPLSGDERVRHVWEILPSPYVPFTRYDDDLGPIQGRRRSVKNTGQQASLTSDTKISYEGREGSAIVSTELEETWSIKTDEDGNSLFPIKNRDFYDASRGPVQERRQLFVPTGEEEGTLENVNGFITQTSYEPYNEFLSVKIVQTYKVDGPQLIGQATDNDGQLVTVTTRRKGSDGYVAPNPTATRTVEANREDAESLIERIVDTPQLFGAKVYRKTKEDLTPQKFKAKQEDSTAEENVAGSASPSIILGAGEFSKSEQQVNNFVKRVSTTSRNIEISATLKESVLTNDGQVGTRTLTLSPNSQIITPSATLVDASIEELGDGRTVKTEVIVDEVFDAKQKTIRQDVQVPPKFLLGEQTQESSVEAGQEADPTLLGEGGQGVIESTAERVTSHKVRKSATSQQITTSISESQINDEKQKVTVESSIVDSPEITPTATTEFARAQAIGGGKYLKEVGTVEEVFDNKTISATKPDVVPDRFRAKLPNKTEAETKEGEAEDPVLEEGEFESSQQNVSAQTVRITKTSREDGPYDELAGQEYEDQFDIGIPYKEKISNEISYGNLKEVTPLGDEKYVVREYDIDAVGGVLNNFYESYPTRISVDVPRILKDFDIVFEQDSSVGEVDVDPEEFYGTSTVSFSTNLSFKRNGSVSLIPQVVTQFETIWGKNLRAKNHLFFLKGPVSESSILSRCGAIAGTWPIFKPISATFTVTGVRISGTAGATVTRLVQQSEDGTGATQQSSTEFDQNTDYSIITVDIPPCLSTGFSITYKPSLNLPLNVFAQLGEYQGIPAIRAEKDATLSYPPPNTTINRLYIIPASDPPDVPRSGVYLMESNITFYKYGWYLVTATTFDASQLA
jgi:hypothetical protein